MKTYSLENYSGFDECEVTLAYEKYAENMNTAIELTCTDDGSPYAIITVNLSVPLPPEYAYIDTNNCPWATKFLEENGLGEPTGEVGHSGFCEYPLFKLNLPENVEVEQNENEKAQEVYDSHDLALEGYNEF